MQRYIFLDLDDTLFQTLRKCPDDTQLKVRAYLPDGTANSFATHKQQWLWQWFSEGFKIIPVTARDAGAFTRVNLPFYEEAVLNHGAVILDKHRNPDAGWMARIMHILPDYYRLLLALWSKIEDYCLMNEGYKARLVHDFDITWYGVIKHTEGNEVPLQQLLDTLIKPHPSIIDGSLYWHLNGNNLAILPKVINKESAVEYLLARYREQHPELLTFGAGDSKTDAAFMALCDYAIIPKNTQLSQLLATA